MKVPRGATAALAVAVLFLIALLAPAAASAAVPAGEQPGYLEISSNPPGAEVYVNQARVDGVTPLTFPVTAGEPQAVVVNLYGYEAALQTVTVQPNETLPLQFDLVLLPGAGGLQPGTAGGVGTPTAPAGEPTADQEIWEEEVPLPASVAVLALLGAGLLAARRR